MTFTQHHKSTDFGRLLQPEHFPRNRETVDEISKSLEPILLKNFVLDWPSVTRARLSDREIAQYLMKFDKGANVRVMVGASDLDGRVFYNEDYSRFNVEGGTSKFSTLLNNVLLSGQENIPNLIYMGSVDTSHCVPGFDNENVFNINDLNPLISMWIGTKTRIAAHNDLPLNIACVVAGKRRFTMFPPEQTPNLYPGPFEMTPAGRPISLVDFHSPDFDRFPKFRDAMKVARVANLEPGDAVFIPSMWWHHVEATGTFNVLVNYWWRTVPNYLGTPQDVLNHAMMTLRDLPEYEKRVWKDIFEYYVFGDSKSPAEHVPEQIRGILAPIDENQARQTRSFIRNRMDR